MPNPITTTQMAQGVPQAPDTTIGAYYNSQGKSATWLRSLVGSLFPTASGYATWASQRQAEYQKQLTDYNNTYNSPAYQKQLLEEAGYNPNYTSASSGSASSASPFQYQGPNNDLQGAKLGMDLISSIADPSHLLNLAKDIMTIQGQIKDNQTKELRNENLSIQNSWLDGILSNKYHGGIEKYKGDHLTNTLKAFNLFGHGSEDERGQTFGYQTRDVQDSFNAWQSQLMSYTMQYRKSQKDTENWNSQAKEYYYKFILPLELSKLTAQNLGIEKDNKYKELQNDLYDRYGELQEILKAVGSGVSSISELMSAGLGIAKTIKSFRQLSKDIKHLNK